MKSFYQQSKIHVKRAVASVAVLLLVTGCVPYATHYFEPSGSGIISGSGMCNDHVGFPEHGRATLGGHRVIMSVDRDGFYWGSYQRKNRAKPSVFLSIGFNLKAGQSVTFDPMVVHLTDKSGKELVLIGNPHMAIEKGPFPPWPVLTEAITRSSYINTETSPTSVLPIKFYWEFEVTKDMKEFILAPSSATLSGVDYTLPTVTFVERFGASILPLNC